MRFPRISFAVGFLLWMTLLAVFSYQIFHKSAMPPVSLEIDASMVDEVEQKKSTQNSVAEKSAEKKFSPEKTVENNSAASVAKKALPLFQPLPKIPDDLREEAFKSEVIARFHIGPDGSVTQIELIKPSANPKLNQLLLRSLRNWKFAPNSTSSTQDIRVNFEVK